MGRKLLAAVVAFAAVWPSTASADVIGGGVPDPQDQAPPIVGPAYPDIAGIQALYDQARGVARFDVAFYAPTGDSVFNVDATMGTLMPDGTCSATGLYLGSAIKTSATTGTVLLTGYTGVAPATVGWTPDQKTMSIYIALPSLTAFAPNCATAQTYLYDVIGHCGDPYCSWWSHTYTFDTTSTVGLAPMNIAQIPTNTPPATPPPATPPPPPPPPPPEPTTRLASPSVRLGSVKTYPCLREIIFYTAKVQGGSTAMKGKLRITLKGISGRARGITRTVSRRDTTGTYNGAEFRQLKPGTYRLQAVYTGDSTRLASPVVTRTLRLAPCL